jgi:hypothetical protein
MKLVFFSADCAEVLKVGKEFSEAGIPCELRNTGSQNGNPIDITEGEVWIRNDKDSHRAMLLCVQQGIGFAKRPPRTSLIECWADISNHSEPEEEVEPYANSEQAQPEANGHRVNGAGRHHSRHRHERHLVGH